MSIKYKSKHICHEYYYSKKGFCKNVVIKAYADVNNRDNEGRYLINISLKTSDKIGLEHFVVGCYTNDCSEEFINDKIEDLADSGYFDGNIKLAYKDEDYLEMKFMEDNK